MHLVARPNVSCRNVSIVYTLRIGIPILTTIIAFPRKISVYQNGRSRFDLT